MLPFLAPKKVAGVIIAKAKPAGGLEPKHEEGEHDPALMSAAEDLLRAVAMKDAEAVCDAMKSMFDILDSDEPKEDELSDEEMGE